VRFICKTETGFAKLVKPDLNTIVETETGFRSVSVNLRFICKTETGFAKLVKPDLNTVSLSKPYKDGGGYRGYGRHIFVYVE